MKGNLVGSIAAATLLGGSVFSPAQAQTVESSVDDAATVKFSNISDAVPGKYFDAVATVADPAKPNRLVIGMNTGVDPKTWVYNVFAASTSAFYRTAAMDTIKFDIAAPEGYYVSKVTYTQWGAGTITRTGKASGGTQLVVRDVTVDLGTFATNPTLTYTVDLTGKHHTVVPVSISTSLFAYAAPSQGTANVGLASAEVLAEVLPLP